MGLQGSPQEGKKRWSIMLQPRIGTGNFCSWLTGRNSHIVPSRLEVRARSLENIGGKQSIRRVCIPTSPFAVWDELLNFSKPQYLFSLDVTS